MTAILKRLRRGWGVLSIIGALAMVLTSLILWPPSTPTYRAEALVVSRQLGMPADEIPDLMATAFVTSTVAERAVQQGLPFEPASLIPDHAQLEIVSDTVAARVVGYAPDRQMAISTANATADAFVATLNEAAPGLVSFAVQERADRAGRAKPTGPGIGGQPQLLSVFALLGLGLLLIVRIARTPRSAAH